MNLRIWLIRKLGGLPIDPCELVRQVRNVLPKEHTIGKSGCRGRYYYKPHIWNVPGYMSAAAACTGGMDKVEIIRPSDLPKQLKAGQWYAFDEQEFCAQSDEKINTLYELQSFYRFPDREKKTCQSGNHPPMSVCEKCQIPCPIGGQN